jgi:hypothetical protein
MMFHAIKIRFFQEARCEFAKEIEKKLSTMITPIETEESKEYLKKGEEKGIIKKHVVSRIITLRVFYVQLFFYISLNVLLIFLLAWCAFQLISAVIN